MRRSQSSPSTDRKGVRDLLVFDRKGSRLPQRVLPRDGEGRRRSVEGERVVDALPLRQGGRPPEAQPCAFRTAVGPHPDVQGGCGAECDGGAVAGDGQPLDEYPAVLPPAPRPRSRSRPARARGRRPGRPGVRSPRPWQGRPGPRRPGSPCGVSSASVSSVAARWSRACWFPASFPLRLPNQRILPLRRSLFLRVFLRLRSLPSPRPARFAIRLSGPGPLLTGCAGAGGSALTSWDTCPA